jgi:hypothetical protein
LLLSCFDALPPCGADMLLDAAASNAVASCRSGVSLIASSGSALIDASIYFDKDSTIFKIQAKQQL